MGSSAGHQMQLCHVLATTLTAERDDGGILLAGKNEEMILLADLTKFGRQPCRGGNFKIFMGLVC